jgi:hypothetical protein
VVVENEENLRTLSTLFVGATWPHALDAAEDCADGTADTDDSLHAGGKPMWLNLAVPTVVRTRNWENFLA